VAINHFSSSASPLEELFLRYNLDKKEKKLKKIIATTLLLTPLLFADEEPKRTVIEPQTLIEYRRLSDQKESCIIDVNIKKLCLEQKIIYPDLSTISDKKVRELIEDDIKKMLKNFKSVELKKELKEQDMEESRDMELYEHNSYDIFSFTPKTVTIEQSNSTYGGGAHGNYATSFKNIDKSSGKELTLKDILKPNSQEAFTKTVENLYRKMRHLSKKDSMKDADWFGDKFELAENFAITPQGLYFLYNSYEVQPYSMGQETIVVPYNKIKEFLSEKYFNEATLKEIDTLAHSYKKRFNNSLKISVTPTQEHTIKLSIEAVNRLYDTTQGWLSVSFKELKGKEVKVKLLNQNFDKFKSYPAGSKIYNMKKKRAIKSHYLLVESEAKAWKSDEVKKLEFELTLPKGLKHLTILVRDVHKFQKRMIEPNKEYEKELVTGQQGHNNFLLNIDL